MHSVPIILISGEGVHMERFHFITIPCLSICSQYASVEKKGEWFMTHEDFVCRYLQLASPGDDSDTIKFLADVADTNKTRWVSNVDRACTYMYTSVRIKN